MISDLFYSVEHPLPGSNQVRSVNLQYFPEYVSRLGGDYRYILDRYGIDASVIDDTESFIDCQSFVDMLEYCASTLGDPLFGFHLAQQQAADVYGFVTVLGVSALNVRTAIHCLIDYLPVVHCPVSTLELVEGETISELRWSQHSNFGSNGQANCQGLLLNLKYLQQVGGAGFKPAYINSACEISGKLRGDFEKAVSCPLNVVSGRNCIAFPTELLERRTPSANQTLYRLLSHYMARLKAANSSGVLDKVNDYVATSMSTGEVSIEGCAKSMGVCTRTLQARLKENGVNFSAVLEQHRLERAKSILKKDELSIAEVADLLGYAERTSFGRAFKRWTGVSPQQFRAAI